MIGPYPHGDNRREPRIQGVEVAGVGFSAALKDKGKRIYFGFAFVLQAAACIAALFAASLCLIRGFDVFNRLLIEEKQQMGLLARLFDGNKSKAISAIAQFSFGDNQVTVTANDVIIIGALYFAIALVLVFFFLKFNSIKLK